MLRPAPPRHFQHPDPKKRALPPGPTGAPAKRARVAPASADTEAWVHRLDGELKQRQASAVQLRCEAEGCGKKHALVASGSYPLREVGCAVAEAFGMAAGDFDPHPNKGTTPPGLRLGLRREGERHPLKPTLKIVQAVQEPGDSMLFEMDGLVVIITLDAIKLKSDAGLFLGRWWQKASKNIRAQQVKSAGFRSNGGRGKNGADQGQLF